MQTHGLSKLSKEVVLLMVVSIVGFGLFQGARLLDVGSGPHSNAPFAIAGIAAGGVAYAAAAIVAWTGRLEKTRGLCIAGIVCALAWLLASGGSGPVWACIAQILGGVGWALVNLCWMQLFSLVIPRYAVIPHRLRLPGGLAFGARLHRLGARPAARVLLRGPRRVVGRARRMPGRVAQAVSGHAGPDHAGPGHAGKRARQPGPFDPGAARPHGPGARRHRGLLGHVRPGGAGRPVPRRPVRPDPRDVAGVRRRGRGHGRRAPRTEAPAGSTSTPSTRCR